MEVMESESWVGADLLSLPEALGSSVISEDHST